MSQLFRRLQNAEQLEKGQGLVEYALILVMVAVVVIAILGLMGPSINRVYFSVVCPLRFPDSSVVINPSDNDSDCRVGGTMAGALKGYWEESTNTIHWS